MLSPTHVFFRGFHQQAGFFLSSLPPRVVFTETMQECQITKQIPVLRTRTVNSGRERPLNEKYAGMDDKMVIIFRFDITHVYIENQLNRENSISWVSNGMMVSFLFIKKKKTSISKFFAIVALEINLSLKKFLRQNFLPIELLDLHLFESFSYYNAVYFEIMYY